MGQIPFAVETVLIMLSAFVLFTLGCWYLARLVTRPEWARLSPNYSRTALRFSQGYKVTAASICVGLWFWVLITSFWSILRQPPF
ncbi:MAG: hypothetical protein ABL958_13585 [Bdellovibrionia bacterium]